MEVPVRGVDFVLLDLWFALMKSSNEKHQVLCMDIELRWIKSNAFTKSKLLIMRNFTMIATVEKIKHGNVAHARSKIDLFEEKKWICDCYRFN